MRIESWSHNASLYCDDCRPDNGCKDPEGCDDSECCPQPNFSSESDSPDHCSACNEFLQNALTGNGMDYVREMLSEPHLIGESQVRAEWRDFYELDKPRNWPVRSVRIEDLAEALSERYRGIYGLYADGARYALDVGSPESDLSTLCGVFVKSGRMASLHAPSGTDHTFTADALACFLRLCLLDAAHGGIVALDASGVLSHKPNGGDRWCDVTPEIAREILLEDFRIEVIDPDATCADQTEETCNADRCVP